MSSLSRPLRPGLVLLCNASRLAVGPSTPVRLLLSMRSAPLRRHFRSVSKLQAAASKLTPRTRAPTAAPRPTSTTPAPPRQPFMSYVESLASKPQATLLYEAPSQFWYRFSCFNAGVFCVSYTVVQYWTIYLHPPPDIAWWVPHAFGAICLFMAGMGAWFATGAGSIVRRIRAVPVRLVPASAASAAASRPAASPLLVEFSVTRPIPFLRDRSVFASPDDVRIPFRISTLLASQRQKSRFSPRTSSTSDNHSSSTPAAQPGRQHQEQPSGGRATAPLRSVAHAVSAAWKGLRRGLNREGFAKVRIGGVECRLDTHGGWALDDGKAIDRVLHVRPAAGTQ
ncbi:hypothetical protein VTK73DRAFT_1776 [Phialemonium thermophilum]|uniref:Uncharacterized protein n=1 Tax=Phialemonium thermophilum TaxID=223376 RepID=A0ABR3X8I5_9PEZI